MKKIIFGITSLTLGGAERVLVDIANELSSEFDITIFTLYGKGEFEKELSNKIHLINMINKSYYELNKKQKMMISFKLLFRKKAIYKKFIDKGYSTEIAFLEGPITRLFSVKNNAHKIAWVHNDIGQVFGQGFKAKLKRMLDKKCYIKYNDVVFVSEDNKNQFEDIYHINNNKLVIKNYISVKRVLEKSNKKCFDIFKHVQPNFLTVARLTEQKAIDRLIKVHSRLINDGYNHMFYVVGDGPEREKLTSLIKMYGVEDTFKLLGKKENPYPYIKNCDIFALLSYYEGLPMTILEARILNKPILITDTASREAVINYDKSYIVDNNEQGIYEGIKNSINYLPKWEEFSSNSYDENYEIIKQIEKLVK